MGLFRRGVNPERHEKREQKKRDDTEKRINEALLQYRLGKISKAQLQAKIGKEHRGKAK